MDDADSPWWRFVWHSCIPGDNCGFGQDDPKPGDWTTCDANSRSLCGNVFGSGIREAIKFQLMNHTNYSKLLLMLAISFLVMYAVMFLNADKFDHVYLSTTRTYMSLLMVTPMALLMLVMMPKMFENKKLNTLVTVSSIVVFGLSLVFLRNQTFISDEQYMKAMIPHHSSAILTSEEAALRDPEVRHLADQIIKSQEREIREMKALLERMKK